MRPSFGILDVVAETALDDADDEIGLGSQSLTGTPVTPKSKLRDKAKRKTTGSARSKTNSSWKTSGFKASSREHDDNDGAIQSPRNENLLNTKADSRIIVGVDFGTTHTGIAYGMNSGDAPNRVHTKVNWPGNPGNLPKVPSNMAYEFENRYWGKNGIPEDIIGFLVRSGMISHTWFKLLLDVHSMLTKYDDPRLPNALGQGSLKLPAGKTAMDLATDFLSGILKLVYQELESSLTKEFLKTTPIDFYITVPALWDDVAKKKTYTIFEEAGFKGRYGRRDMLKMITEPEAAAIDALTCAQEESGLNFKKESVALIVDGGGGTIDLTAMEVVATDPLKLLNICPGEGGKCGSTQIDRDFLALLSQRYGTDFDELPEKKRGVGSELMAQFEREKRAFTGQLYEDIGIRLPALIAGRDNSNTKLQRWDDDEAKILLSEDEMKDLHKTTLQMLCELTKQQVHRLPESRRNLPDVIIFCGGMAASEYIFTEFKTFCYQEFGEYVKVLRPRDPWGAIARGAVTYGLRRSVMVGRVARRSYGLEAHENFDPELHPEARAVDCPKFGKRVAGKIQWFTKKARDGQTVCSYMLTFDKGQRVNLRTPQRIKGYIVPGEEYKFTYTIFSSKIDQLPEYVDEEGVEEIGKLAIDITRVLKEENEKKVRQSTERQGYAEFNIVTTVGDDEVLLKVEAKMGRKVVGSMKLNYTRDY